MRGAIAVLCLRFTAADLGRITLAPRPNEVLETILSAHPRSGTRRVRRRMSGRPLARTGVLTQLVGADGFIPGFLLQPECDDLASGAEWISQTSDAHLSAGLCQAAGSRDASCWFRQLAAGSRDASCWFRQLAAGAAEARRTLVSDLRAHFTSSLAPIWPLVQAAAAADRSFRAETLLRGGIDALLSTLNVGWHWDSPVLRIPSRLAYEVELCGRGLLLIPSYYSTGTPLLAYRPGHATVLVYPMYHGDAPSTAGDALGPLLGRTRAAVLAALRDPATTTTLAERVRISLASASQHATVLRKAGLISTTRVGGAVLHALTPLGVALTQRDPVAR